MQKKRTTSNLSSSMTLCNKVCLCLRSIPVGSGAFPPHSCHTKLERFRTHSLQDLNVSLLWSVFFAVANHLQHRIDPHCNNGNTENQYDNLQVHPLVPPLKVFGSTIQNNHTFCFWLCQIHTAPCLRPPRPESSSYGVSPSQVLQFARENRNFFQLYSPLLCD
jgi:hypothetical protein